MFRKSKLIKFEIAKLELKSDDILVIKTHELLPEDTKERIRSKMRKILPLGVEIVILTGDVEFSVITKNA